MSAPRFDVDLALERPGFSLAWRLASDARCLGLYGPSGSGKSTALELLLGWRAATRGRALVGGVAQTPGTAPVGYAPQDLLLLPHLDVAGNLLLGAAAAAPAPRRERVVAGLELGPLLQRPARRLSGGEARRVALARALLAAPDDGVLALDEPFASLDRERRRRALGLLLDLLAERSGPTVVVSHRAADLQVLCEEVQAFERTGGGTTRPAPSGPAREVLLESGGFENLLPGRVVEVAGDAARLELEGGATVSVPGLGLAVGEGLVCGLRADDVLVTLDDPGRVSARNVLSGHVASVRPLSSYRTLEVHVDGAPPLATHVTEGAVRELGLAPGSAVHLVFKTRSVVVLASGR